MIPKQIVILIIFVLIYFGWALIYHKKSKSLTMPTVLEYLLIAVLTLLLLAGVYL